MTADEPQPHRRPDWAEVMEAEAALTHCKLCGKFVEIENRWEYPQWPDEIICDLCRPTADALLTDEITIDASDAITLRRLMSACIGAALVAAATVVGLVYLLAHVWWDR